MNKRKTKKNTNKKQANKVVLTQQEKETKYRKSRLKHRVQREIATANKRLGRLVDNNLNESSNAYRALERKLFDGSKYLIEKERKDGKSMIQFKLGIDLRKADWNTLEAIDSILTKFINAHTSTTRGVRKKYLQGYKSYKESTGSNLSESEYAQQFADGLFNRYSQLYSSSQAHDFFVTARNEKLSTDEIKEILDKNETRKPMTTHREMLKELQHKKDLEKYKDMLDNNEV